MLDPLTALSVAGNIVQFIDFSTKLIAKGHELYNSADGASVGNAELEVIAKDLQDLNGRLQSPRTFESVKAVVSDSGLALQTLSKKCSGVAAELTDALNKLKVQGTANRRWKSVRQALKGLMRKEELDAMVKRLQLFRDELNLHILVSMRDTLDMQAIRLTEGFQHLDEVAQNLVDRLEQDQRRLRTNLENHTERIIHNQNNTNDIITREHEQTRITILTSLYSGRSCEPSETQDCFSGGSEDLSQQEKHYLIESSLLASLRFPNMEDRFEEIEPAHKKTFEWIFEPPAQQSKWSNFPQWLSDGIGLYWINGKAASGKSTLMRFICEDPRTDTLLNEWSSPGRLIRAAHFFWNSGRPDQRSYQGLLRALLFDILRRARHLIRVVFSEKWAAHQRHPTDMLPALESWTLPRLIKAFDLLFQKAGTELRFCLFVDGLDEYDGDPFDIIDLFMRISKSPNVKLCLSSRPLYDFVKSFRAFPTLRLQDLNSNDIKQYVNDKLKANHQMQALQRKEPEQAPQLSQEIIDKADGVFLWVRLVVFSLLRGLRNSDQVSDLQRRLHILPPSLEDLFSHILGRLEPVYMEQSSRIFQIFAASTRPKRDTLTSTISPVLTSLELSFAEETDAQRLLCSLTGLLTDDERMSRIETVNIWLVTRCGGLIEAKNPSNLHDINRNLSYLHRTVRDFLVLPQVWSRIIGYTRGSDFNPHFSLLQSSVLFIRLVLEPDIDSSVALDFAYVGRKHAYQAAFETNRPQVLLLDELDRMIEDVNHLNEPYLKDESSLSAKVHENSAAYHIFRVLDVDSIQCILIWIFTVVLYKVRAIQVCKSGWLAMRCQAFRTEGGFILM